MEENKDLVNGQALEDETLDEVAGGVYYRTMDNIYTEAYTGDGPKASAKAAKKISTVRGAQKQKQKDFRLAAKLNDNKAAQFRNAEKARVKGSNKGI